MYPRDAKRLRQIRRQIIHQKFCMLQNCQVFYILYWFGFMYYYNNLLDYACNFFISVARIFYLFVSCPFLRFHDAHCFIKVICCLLFQIKNKTKIIYKLCPLKIRNIILLHLQDLL